MDKIFNIILILLTCFSWFACGAVAAWDDGSYWGAMGHCVNGCMGLGFLVFIVLNPKK
jgi:hypothetical protein